MSPKTLLVVLGLLSLAVVGAMADVPSRTLLATPPATTEIPSECQQAGLNLQSACSSDITKATAFFGVSPDKAGTVPQSKITAYLADPANKPSAGCCSAASAFNSARCGCNSAVLDLAAAYVGGDRSVYEKVSSAIASLCGFSKVC